MTNLECRCAAVWLRLRGRLAPPWLRLRGCWRNMRGSFTEVVSGGFEVRGTQYVVVRIVQRGLFDHLVVRRPPVRAQRQHDARRVLGNDVLLELIGERLALA